MNARSLVFAVLLPGILAQAQSPVTISSARVHLRSGDEPEWTEFASMVPAAKRLDISFEARADNSEATLFIQQDDVRHDWFVEINRKRIGKLFLMEADLVHALAVPAGTLRNGSNQLSVIPPRDNDDIFLREIRLDSRTRSHALNEAGLAISVRDADTGQLMPSRVTVVTEHGALAPLLALGDTRVAVRPGVVYHRGEANVGIPEANYVVYASRGFEWSVATQRVHVARGGSTRVELKLRREVPATGWINSDTHIHKATNHGDATEDERALTLAGEGIEMPITTEHNTNSGYAAATERMAVGAWYTPVMGNEVTTTTAHFNIFPVEPGPGPDQRIMDWPKLMAEMRATPGVRVVVLNHPLNIHNKFQPFAATNYDVGTGENLRGAEFSFDAIEVVNSSAQQSDYMDVYRGWFGLLNYGYRATGLGSSDSHDVSRYIVGQGRTYIRASDTDPSRIDVAAACSNLLAGRALVSMGLLVDMRVNDRFGVGDTATNPGTEIKVSIQIHAPSWSLATNVALYANGILLREQRVEGTNGSTLNWSFPRPRHDIHLVAIATGPGITAPYWAIPRPYQPTTKKWEGRVIASTNPIWLDADGDGHFSPARDIARRLISENSGDKARIEERLDGYDPAVRLQVSSLLRKQSGN